MRLICFVLTVAFSYRVHLIRSWRSGAAKCGDELVFRTQRLRHQPSNNPRILTFWLQTPPFSYRFIGNISDSHRIIRQLRRFFSKFLTSASQRHLVVTG
ncbi:hypothetical protein BJ508DRAFT_73350 [Ascobolus immersus RN42]|uniref:Secreted protein n=1 Tax=Ascobolus immersus RN42 TaxID=1160509 RepID=A0A3N4HS02_ASCIM|nr:hypothetical protein BJ508DRAFT_73350 [Ascobolus immersus RN42]